MRTASLQFPSGLSISVRAFLRAWQTLRSIPEKDLRGMTLPNFTERGRGASYVTVKRWMGDQLHARINQHIPAYGCGRKWSDRWQSECTRAARGANESTLPLARVPKDLEQRLAHRRALRTLRCVNGCASTYTVCLRKRCAHCHRWMTP
jgi:hypothetical protein